MVVIIDNYDSFVHNLARYVGQLGFARRLFRNDAISVADVLALQPSHIILSPGPCTPAEAGICLDLIARCYQTIPLLGVCLGHQAIGAAFGGTVTRAQVPMHGKPSLIEHHQQGILQGLANPLQVGRYHSLIIDSATLPICLEVTAWSQDKEIMALAHKDFPVYGVQFHPESILTEHGYELLSNFLHGTVPKKACQGAVARYDTNIIIG